MNHVVTNAATAALLVVVCSAGEAQAGFFNPNLKVPSITEDVVCRVIRERIVTPGGRVVFRERRVCRPGPIVAPVIPPPVLGPRCTMIRERIVRPGGAVVYRSVRRCRPI
jgi:hypothetical protein